METIINFNLIINNMYLLCHGFMYSLLISAGASLIGIFGGLSLALLIYSKNKLAKFFCYTYVTVIRGTPMIVQLLILFFTLPMAGIYLAAIWVAIIAIGMNSMAYMSQVFLTGINAIPHGQIDAAKIIGMNKSQILRYIIIPQTFYTIFPSLINECITLIKDSSLAHIIGVAELLHQGNIIINRSYDVISIYFAIAIIFLISTSFLTLIFKYIESKISWN